MTRRKWLYEFYRLTGSGRLVLPTGLLRKKPSTIQTPWIHRRKRLTTRFVPRAATTAQIGPTQNFYGNGSPLIRGFVNVALGTDVMQRRGALTIGFLAQGPSVLALHAHRMLAGFGKSRVIDQKDPVWIGQGFGHRSPVLAGHSRLVPAALTQELAFLQRDA
jgi:hypothetical protein